MLPDTASMVCWSTEDSREQKTIKVPLSLLVDTGSLLYALVSVFHPDWLIRSKFRLRRSDNLHKDSQQKSTSNTRINAVTTCIFRYISMEEKTVCTS